MNCMLFVIYNKTIEKRESAGRYTPSTAMADGGTGFGRGNSLPPPDYTGPLSTGPVLFVPKMPA